MDQDYGFVQPMGQTHSTLGSIAFVNMTAISIINNLHQSSSQLLLESTTSSLSLSKINAFSTQIGSRFKKSGSDRFYFDSSLTMSEEEGTAIAQYLAAYLSDSIPELQSIHTSPDGNSLELFSKQISSLYRFIAYYTNFQLSEAVHSVLLIKRLVESDLKLPESFPRAISSATIGLVLICGCSLAMKYSRDRSFTNSWFATNFKVPLADYNSSERNFLNRVNFDMCITELEFCSCVLSILS